MSPVSLPGAAGAAVDWEGGGVLQLQGPRQGSPAGLRGGAGGGPRGGPGEGGGCGARRRLFCPQLSFPHVQCWVTLCLPSVDPSSAIITEKLSLQENSQD